MDIKSFQGINNLIEVVKRKNIVKSIYSGGFYNDEPKIYSFITHLHSTNKYCLEEQFSIGSSFLKTKALVKSLGEGVERYFLSVYQKQSFVWGSYKFFQTKSINPRKFLSFSKYKIKPNFPLYINENDKLNWVKGFSLTDKKNILIPAQFIFVPYEFKAKEPVIRFPITTGAACYSSLKGAILNGLLEVIERDAFMINYLNKLSRNIIDIGKSGDKTLEKIITSIKRYNLELYTLDISTDVPVYTIMTIIIDRTGLGPAVSLGMKSSLKIKNAIIGAIEECLHGRFWIREIMMESGRKKIKEIQKKKYYITDIKERGILWSDLKMISKIKFFLESKTIGIKKLSEYKSKDLDELLAWFKKEKIGVLYVDVTSPNLKRKKIYVVKVIVPQFQPLYLDERFPYWKGERLKEIPEKLGFKPLEKINKFPHPFL